MHYHMERFPLQISHHSILGVPSRKLLNETMHIPVTFVLKTLYEDFVGTIVWARSNSRQYSLPLDIWTDTLSWKLEQAVYNYICTTV